MSAERDLHAEWLKAKQAYDDAKSEWEDANNTLHDARRKYEAAYREWHQFNLRRADNAGERNA